MNHSPCLAKNPPPAVQTAKNGDTPFFALRPSHRPSLRAFHRQAVSVWSTRAAGTAPRCDFGESQRALTEDGEERSGRRALPVDVVGFCLPFGGENEKKRVEDGGNRSHFERMTPEFQDVLRHRNGTFCVWVSVCLAIPFRVAEMMNFVFGP